MNVWKLAIIAFLLGITLIGAPATVDAYTCGTPPPNELIRRASIIFRGEVVRAEPKTRDLKMKDGRTISIPFLQATFLVSKVWKGRIGSNVYVKVNARRPGMDGWGFKVGSTYVVAAYFWEGMYRTGACPMYELTREPSKSQYIAAFEAYANAQKNR